MRQALRVVISTIVLSLILSSTVLRADSHEVRYTPSNEAYGACRAQFPYSHLEDCNKDYDFLMLFWLKHLESQAEPIVYESCEAAKTAGVPLQQGSIGDEFGFPVELVPTAPNGDGDTMVCERPSPTSAPLTRTVSRATPNPQPDESCLVGLIYITVVGTSLQNVGQADLKLADMEGEIGMQLVQILAIHKVSTDFLDFLESSSAPYGFNEGHQLLTDAMRTKIEALDAFMAGDLDTFNQLYAPTVSKFENASTVLLEEAEVYSARCQT